MNNREENLKSYLAECQYILLRMANKYKNIYNGDKEEAYANACLWTIELYDGFDRNKSKFTTYIYSIIDNKFKDEWRKKNKEYKLFASGDIEDYDEKGMINTDLYENDYDDILTSGQKDRYSLYFDLYKYTNILNDREKVIFKLFYYNNWKIEDIASVVELSAIRVKEIKKKIIIRLEKEKKNN